MICRESVATLLATTIPVVDRQTRLRTLRGTFPAARGSVGRTPGERGSCGTATRGSFANRRFGVQRCAA